jgi:PEP-CTERM motif
LIVKAADGYNDAHSVNSASGGENMLKRRENIALAALLPGLMALFVAPASASVTFSFADLAMATEVNGLAKEPIAYVSGSVTVSKLTNDPGEPGPIPQRRVEAVNLTISLDGKVIRSFDDPSYFAYMSYINDYGIDELMVGPGINLIGLPLDRLWDLLSLDFYQGMVSGTFATLGYTSFQTYDYQEVGYVESAPEPSTWAMVALGFAGVGYFRRRRVARQPRAA